MVPPAGREHVGLILLLAGAILAPPAASRGSAAPRSATDTASVVCVWLPSEGDWVVEIEPCAAALCGRLVGLRRSHRPNALRMDAHNPDPAMRGRPLCGLTVLGGFKPATDGGGKWDGGWIYDPESGKTYASVMSLAGPNTLVVRDYVLIPLFGRSETFTRETGPINRCADTPGGWGFGPATP
ncbi:MAG: DUF2147 domain-containing protein [Proteobacteria bacterium]|nr:DUF2147 domain-containing protein [Pseudomonadota bacterium]